MRKDIVENSVTNNAAQGIIVSHVLRPTAHFDHPNDVLHAAHLSEQDKRAILASWASDQYAVESIPALRHYPGSPAPVSLDEVLGALRSLDGDAREEWKTSPDINRPARRLDLRCLVPMRCRTRRSRTMA
jgi:hypothetical protein